MDTQNKEQVKALLSEQKEWQDIKELIFDKRNANTRLTIKTDFVDRDNYTPTELFRTTRSFRHLDRLISPILDRHFEMIVKEIEQHITDIDEKLKTL